MAASWCTISLTPSQLPFCSASAAPSRCNTHFLKVYSSRRGMLGFFLAQKQSSMRTLAVESNQLSSLQTHHGTWEDPDDGSGSEYDEEDDLDFESDREEEKDTVLATFAVEKSQKDKYEEELVKEIEQLLGPEERAILQQSATPNLQKISTAKWSLLHTLGLSGQIPFMDKLLEQGVDIDFVDKVNLMRLLIPLLFGFTPFVYCSFLTEKYLEHDGLTALHTAILGKKEAVISHLLRKGASPHVKDRDGATPLHYAVHVGAMQIVKLLIKYNVDVNVADNEGWTPLHIAVQSRNRDIVKVLLLNGADKNRRNKDGETPLDLSLCYGIDFKSYDLASFLKIVPGNRDLLFAGSC